MALIMVWLYAAPLHAALSSNPDQAAIPQPEVGLEPQDVVTIVINALANNDKPFVDAGIATTFAFASPSNKVNTGPLDKFTQMVKNDVYGIMVNGIEIVFAFRLSKQIDGEFDGMWMTDAVWPVGDAMVPQQGF
jgi:hypothetical protein